MIGALAYTGLGSDQRVGVQVASLASMTLAKDGAATSPLVFEDDIVAAHSDREVEAAAVTLMMVGWFNLQHADKPTGAPYRRRHCDCRGAG